MSDHYRNESIEDVSTAFDLLRDARRRGVLYTLRRNGRTSVEELSRRIAAWEPNDGRTATDPETVETSLVHAHLPKLADAGVVEFDRERGAVELADSADELDPLLRSTRERERDLFEAARKQSVNA